jgi:hypothetical protein
LPYNALHYHAESQHLEALYSPELDAHQCELDLNNCQGEFNHSCQHPQHIGSSHAKCFTCQFHFTKGYVGAMAKYQELIPVSTELAPICFDVYRTNKPVNTGNKDPPIGLLV